MHSRITSRIGDAVERDFQAEFYSEIFEQRELFIQNSFVGNQLSTLLDLEYFEDLLWGTFRLKPGAIQISKDSILLGEKEKAGIDIIRYLPKLLSDGYSIIINYAEEFSPTLALFARDFGAAFGCPAHLSVFLTPPIAAAFKAHYDAIDVFAIQVEGEKNWEIGGTPTRLPLGTNTFAVGPEPEMKSTYRLSKSDLLYVPRGVVHRVSAPPHDLSLHVSVALATMRNGVILSEAVRVLEEGDVNLRRSDLASAQHGPLKCVATGVEEAAQKIVSPYVTKTARARIACRNHAGLPQLPGRLRQYQKNQTEISGQTALRRRTGMPCEVLFLQDGGLAAISFPGLGAGRPNKEDALLTFPGQLIVPLEYIRDAKGAFRAAEIPGRASIDTKVMLVRRLALEGLLEQDEM